MSRKKPVVESEIQTLKITNPLWIETLASYVKDYWERIKFPGLTYEALMAFLTGTVQYGSDLAEMWVAFKDNKPVGFCVWFVMGPPIFGVSHCDHIAVWDDDDRISKALIEKFIEFADKRRTPYIHGLLVNQKVADHFKLIGEQFGIDVQETGKVELFGRRK